MTQTTANLRMMDTGVITPLDFGATGDGTVDDTTAVQNAFNSDKSIIDLLGKTYKVTSTLTISRNNVTVRNGTLYYQGTDHYDASVVSVTGSVGTAYTTLASSVNYCAFVSGNRIALTNQTAATVSDEFSVNDYILLQTGYSTYSSITQPMAEMHRLRKINSTDRILMSENECAGNYSGAATVSKVTTRDNIVFDNVTFKNWGTKEFDLGSNPLTSVSSSTNLNIVIPLDSLGIQGGEKITLANGSGVAGSFTVPIVPTTYDIASESETTGSTTVVATLPSATTTGGLGGGTQMQAYYGNNSGLSLDMCSNVTVRHCSFDSVSRDVVASRCHGIIYVNNSSAGIHSYVDSALAFNQGTTNISIKDNVCSGSYIKWLDTTSTTIGGAINVLCTGNLIRGVLGTGITFGGNTNQATVTNNTIKCTLDTNHGYTKTHRVSAGIDVGCFKALINSNDISGFSYFGIRLEQTFNALTAVSGRSSFGGGTTSTTLKFQDNLGLALPSPIATVSNNMLSGMSGNTDSVGCVGVIVKPAVENSPLKANKIINNTITGVWTGVRVDTTSTYTNTDGSCEYLDISGNHILPVRETGGVLTKGAAVDFERSSGISIHKYSSVTNNTLALDSYSRGGITGGSLISPGTSTSVHVRNQFIRINSNTFLHGLPAIDAIDAAMSPYLDGILGVNVFAGSNSNGTTAGSYAPTRDANAGDPLGAPSTSTSPSKSAAIQQIAGGVINQFFGPHYTGS